MASVLKKMAEKFGLSSRVTVNVADTDIVNIDDSLTIKEDEVRQLYSDIFAVAYQDNRNSTAIDESGLWEFILPIQESLMSKKSDYDKLCKIAPEIDNASSILIPSILSPNSLKPIDGLNIIIPHDGVDEEIKTKIIEVISYHFNVELKLYKKLAGWIESALIKEGAKPLMLIPAHVIRKLKEMDLTSPSTESLSMSIESLAMKKIYGSKSILNRGTSASIESIVSTMDIGALSKAIQDDTKKDIDEFIATTEIRLPNKGRGLYLDGDFSVEAVKGIIKNSEADKFMSFIENPEVLALSKFRKQNSFKKISKEFDSYITGNVKSDIDINLQLKREPFIDLSSAVSESAEKDDIFPLIEELPVESVIPIITKGSAEDALGYFVILDDYGYPLSIDNMTDDMSIGSSDINRLFYAMKGTDAAQQNNNGGNTIKGILPNSTALLRSNFGTSIKRRTTNKIINEYIDATLKRAVSDIGLSSFDVKTNENIMSAMMQRILHRKKTYLLFVPKSIMFYLAFSYNKDGTGKSKLENIKFPLSLKMTFMITKLMGLMESATNRKRVEVQFEENKGLNHLELIRGIKNRFIQSRMNGLSYDPSKILSSHAERQISIMPKNIPGIQNLDIRDESAPRAFPRPEAELFEEINNMYILGFDVPPSALNQLGESEFSRSIATYNFFFSNKIINYQSIICFIMSGLISSYIRYSIKLKNQIMNILKDEKAKPLDDEDIIDSAGTPMADGSVTEKDESESEEEIENRERIFDYIVSSIKMTLPSPKIVYDKAQYDEINNYIQIIDGIINGIYPEEMIEDRDLIEIFKVIKSFMKAEMVSKYLNDINAFNQFGIEDMRDIDIDKIINTKQIILNVNKILKDIKEKLDVVPAAEGEQESQWG